MFNKITCLGNIFLTSLLNQKTNTKNLYLCQCKLLRPVCVLMFPCIYVPDMVENGCY